MNPPSEALAILVPSKSYREERESITHHSGIKSQEELSYLCAMFGGYF
jgi:hypothetical protein